MKKIIFILGILVIIMSLGLTTVFPQEAAWLPDGFTVPIVAYEFLQSDAEVLQFFGTEPSQQKQLVTAMNKGHQLDYIYLCIYALFLAAWGRYAALEKKQVFFNGIIILAAITAVADIGENIQLVSIANQLESGSFAPQLELLYRFTWLKWGALVLSLLGLSPYTIQQDWLGKTLALISVLTFVLSVFAFAERSILTSYFTKGIALQFLLLVLLISRQLRSK